MQMHPVPPDWALANPTTTETLEDSDPNQRHPSLNKEGGTKVEKDVDFGAGSKSNGGNSSSSSSASSDMEISERE